MSPDSDSSRTVRRRPTARTLHRLLVAACALGMTALLVTIVLKLAADDFRGWRALCEGNATVARLVERFPVLDLERRPALARWSWHDATSRGVLGTYAKDAGFLFFLLLVLVVFRRRITARLEPAAAWLRASDHRRARVLVGLAVTLVVGVYLTKAFLGFWFPGIGGWTYGGWHTGIRQEMPALPAGARVYDPEQHPWLARAINADLGPLIEREGFLSGPAVFLHPAEGEPRPVNFELTGVVFPQNVFGHPERGAGDEALFWKLMKRGLEQRRAGRRFLLPRSVAYPPHSIYPELPAGPLPAAAEVRKVSFWKLTVRLDHDAEIRLVRAVLEHEIDVR